MAFLPFSLMPVRRLWFLYQHSWNNETELRQSEPTLDQFILITAISVDAELIAGIVSQRALRD